MDTWETPRRSLSPENANAGRGFFPLGISRQSGTNITAACGASSAWHFWPFRDWYSAQEHYSSSKLKSTEFGSAPHRENECHNTCQTGVTLYFNAYGPCRLLFPARCRWHPARRLRSAGIKLVELALGAVGRGHPPADEPLGAPVPGHALRRHPATRAKHLQASPIRVAERACKCYRPYTNALAAPAGLRTRAHRLRHTSASCRRTLSGWRTRHRRCRCRARSSRPGRSCRRRAGCWSYTSTRYSRCRRYSSPECVSCG